MFIDSHCHIYLEEFNADRAEAIQRALDAGVKKILLPNIDKESLPLLLKACSEFPGICYPMIGLHPTSVNENASHEWDYLSKAITEHSFIAIGEIGIDLYWDTQFAQLQEEYFRLQVELSIEKKLPIVIHSRKALHVLFRILKEYKGKGLKGVFHCFPGNIEEAHKVIDLGFHLGIGGVITYKNATMAEVAGNLPLDSIILETDAPFLPPVPYRGKRNEPAYIPLIASHIAIQRGTSTEEIEKETTKNTEQLFSL